MNCRKYFPMNEICSQEILSLFALVGGILGLFMWLDLSGLAE